MGAQDSRLASDPDHRRRLRAWLEAELPASWRADDVAWSPPDFEARRVWEARMYRAGLAGIAWPREHGGHGLGLREHLLANQEIGRLAMPESVNSIGKELVGPILLAVGSQAQKQRHLPAILEMREIWCQGFSEPEAGSDLAGVRTRAVHDGTCWRVSGQKIWTSNAFRAQRCLLLARTGPLEERHRSLSLFALPMDAPGITVRQMRQMNDSREFCEVFFDDVPVPDCDLIGGINDGWMAAIGVLEIERATNRMYRTWRFENELRHLVAACRSDPRLAALLADGYFRQRLGATMADIEALRHHVLDAVDSLAEGDRIAARGSLMKLHWSEGHQRFLALAVEMLGRAPADAGAEVRRAQERFHTLYLSARAETIYAGTSQIQLGIIADRILKLTKGEARA